MNCNRCCRRNCCENCCEQSCRRNMNNRMFNNITENSDGMITGCSRNNSCNTRQQTFPDNYLYGYAYTPNQMINETFNPRVGLQNGTIFPELLSPYCPGQSMDFINSLRNGGCNNE